MSFVSCFVNAIGEDLPCSDNCRFCEWVGNIIEQSDDVSQVWREWQDQAAQGNCHVAKKTAAATKGSIFTLTGFCYHCQITIVPMRANYTTMTAEPLFGAVDVDNFGMRLGDSIMNCSLDHDQSAVDIKCFGTIPQFCLISTSSNIDVRVRRFVPLRITEEHGHIVLCDSFEETFLGKCIYVPNPCYLESWVSGEARVLWVSNPNPRQYALAQMRSHPFDENKWDLSEVVDSKPFLTPSGPYKIFEACTSGRGRLEFSNISVFRAQNHKETPAVEVSLPNVNERFETEPRNEENPRTDRPETVVVSSDQEAVISREESNEADDSGDSDSEYEGRGIQIVDDYEEQFSLEFMDDPVNVLGDYRPTSIPFLFASYPMLWASEYENWHYGGEGPRRSASFRQGASQILAGGDLFLPGISTKEILAFGIQKDALLSESSVSLRLCCDIDSIDIISIPWGGCAFRGESMKVLSQYSDSYCEPAKYLARNNNFTGFQESGQWRFPGRFFLSDTASGYSPAIQEMEGDPIALTIMEMKTSLSMNNIAVRALVPSGSVELICDGYGALIELFMKNVNGNGELPGTRRASQRYVVSRMLWYMIKEVLLFMLSFVTREMRYPTCGSRKSRCAVPSAANSKYHDRERGPNSSFGDGMVIEREEVAAGFYLAARFFAALEHHSELPERYRSYNELNQELFKCPESLINLVEDEECRNCLRAEIGEDNCNQFFSEHVWGEKVICGGMVRLQSNENRRGASALPSAESNRSAAHNGQLVLEDLLVLSPIIFRVTQHGNKKRFGSARQGSVVKAALEREFRLEMTQDGITDVGFTLEGPRNSGWAVTLPQSTARASKLLVPVHLSGKTFRQLNASLYSAHGYPELCGFST